MRSIQNPDSYVVKPDVESMSGNKLFSQGFYGHDEMRVRQSLNEYLKRLKKQIGHFRVPPGLCFKTRVGAQPLI